MRVKLVFHYFLYFVYFHLEHSRDEADEQHQHVEQAERHEARVEGDELRMLIHPIGRIVRSRRLRLHLHHLLDAVYISQRRHRFQRPDVARQSVVTFLQIEHIVCEDKKVTQEAGDCTGYHHHLPDQVHPALDVFFRLIARHVRHFVNEKEGTEESRNGNFVTPGDRYFEVNIGLEVVEDCCN